ERRARVLFGEQRHWKAVEMPLSRTELQQHARDARHGTRRAARRHSADVRHDQHDRRRVRPMSQSATTHTLSEPLKQRILAEVPKYPDPRSALLMALHFIQEEIGHVPFEVQREVANLL